MGEGGISGPTRVPSLGQAGRSGGGWWGVGGGLGVFVYLRGGGRNFLLIEIFVEVAQMAGGGQGDCGGGGDEKNMAAEPPAGLVVQFDDMGKEVFSSQHR